jgi:hypothetical protein
MYDAVVRLTPDAIPRASCTFDAVIRLTPDAVLRLTRLHLHVQDLVIQGLAPFLAISCHNEDYVFSLSEKLSSAFA